MSRDTHKPDPPMDPAAVASSESTALLENQDDCQELREDYLFGMLTLEEESAYLGHAEGCDACKLALEAHHQLDGAFLPLEEAARVPSQVTAHEHQALLEHVELQASRTPPVTPEEGLWVRFQRLLFGDVQPGRVAWVWPLAAAACLALLVLPSRRSQGPAKKPRKRARITVKAQATPPHRKAPQQPARLPVHRALAKRQAPRQRLVAAVAQVDLAAFIALPEDQPGASKNTTQQPTSTAAHQATTGLVARAAPRRPVAARQSAKAPADEPREKTERDFPEEPTIQARPDGTLEQGKPLPTLAALSGRSQGLQRLVAAAPSAQQRAAQPRPFRTAVVSLD